MTHSPGTTLGYPLRDRTRANGTVIRAVSGFDVTLSAPKSLSVWWALTGDSGLVECHDVAVRAVVDYLERFGSTTRVRSNGARLHPDSQGLMVATFRQTTSRLDDPQLHTHLVVSAKVQTDDGRWLALDARVLKHHQRALGGLYQSVLRAELTDRYGVALGEIVKGQAEIAGVPTVLLQQFSKRAAQVRAALNDKVDEFRQREGRHPSKFEHAALEREAAADTRHRKTGSGVPDLRARWQLARGSTIVVDEAGMLSTPDLYRLTQLATNQQWRLALVGDHRQLQAVGRGGMFAELCTTSRAIELERIHRFTNQWEAAASLKLRHGDLRALDAYKAHDRIIPGTLDEHLDGIADDWIERHDAGKTVAITTTTNDHVDAINHLVQQRRIEHGALDPTRVAVIADGEAMTGDVVATRRNQRQLHTSTGDVVRNRELWTVTQISDSGDLTVTQLDGHGTITLPAGYVGEHVRLGYAATEPGNQSDNQTGSITLATPATAGRGLYVAMTRGQQENHVRVVTETHDITEARDILETIMTSDRADIPAIAQRRQLSQQDRPVLRLHPRCEIPDWFNDLRLDAAADYRARRDKHSTTHSQPATAWLTRWQSLSNDWRQRTRHAARSTSGSRLPASS